MQFGRGRTPSVLAVGDRGPVDLGLADETGCVAERGEVGAPSEVETRLVVGEDRRCSGRSVHGLGLGEVLEDRYELNALARGARRKDPEAL